MLQRGVAWVCVVSSSCDGGSEATATTAVDDTGDPKKVSIPNIEHSLKDHNNQTHEQKINNTKLTRHQPDQTLVCQLLVMPGENDWSFVHNDAWGQGYVCMCSLRCCSHTKDHQFPLASPARPLAGWCGLFHETLLLLV